MLFGAGAAISRLLDGLSVGLRRKSQSACACLSFHRKKSSRRENRGRSSSARQKQAGSIRPGGKERS